MAIQLGIHVSDAFAHWWRFRRGVRSAGSIRKCRISLVLRMKKPLNFSIIIIEPISPYMNRNSFCPIFSAM